MGRDAPPKCHEQRKPEYHAPRTRPPHDASSEARNLRLTPTTDSEERGNYRFHQLGAPIKAPEVPVDSSKWNKFMKKVLTVVLPDTSKIEGKIIYNNGQWRFKTNH
ncbi:hypothetical protein PHYSODRAFT_307390 [Phytophthora sojae]|uniref:Uncharacterized protein n=1 Tax=Phytophthora sojae (strain P6497) TaxID=1094619 RepID=G5AE96_PHYSP|nr:hypothetical protein PHYSODRAFT_307390 [Phytophthora sojae]EGZ06498.1 hypothetical protein PHYSODRAFT_307390 [Phytophthora sojae]|eukprot:XP_009538395.1 hypothetical protein PHYSODRAFT_307390 [Phytophthora sojae]